jgi:ElaB/YqjD/DUF883 family membrane-anchored ribosome-binding protein
MMMQTTNELPPEHCQAAALVNKKARQLKIAERQFMADCRGYISDNPVATLSVAMGMGFVLSRLFSAHQCTTPVTGTK